MLKKILLILLVVCLLTSCTSKKNIVNDSYSNGDVNINYPMIENKDYTEINELIKKEALKVLDNYGENNISSLNIDYEISYINKKIISIKYTGIGNMKKAVYPNDFFYTTNIDMDNKTILKLADVVDADETFIENFRNDNFRALKDQQRLLLKDLSDDEIIEKLSTDNFYISENSLGISVDVLHVLGDHAEYEIKYGNIDNTKWDNFNSNYINEK
ncbi:hypothetical protein SH1V18_10470 [Vallitalea longa]|uniref:Uncharacterized protein n=1 Tax=Vallitalea longa TaxID=2936439 RepID=A0A9W5Y7S9_9FIRM|nr:hypothetical protein [Vallitalea longa]GKX28567.1 hypothetical protein SH1V18_10470 [Vallitalea longa]